MKADTKLISQITLSGSGDFFRNAIGGLWELVDVEPIGSESTLTEVISPIPPLGLTAEGVSAKRNCIGYVHLGATTYGSVMNHDTSDGKLIPNLTVNVRIGGDSEYIKSDDHWKTMIVGGHYGGDSYLPILSGAYYENNSFSYYIPYNQYEYNTFIDAGGSEIDYLADLPVNPVEIRSHYNVHLPQYESHISTLDSELLIPNIYWLRSFSLFPPDGTSYGDYTGTHTYYEGYDYEGSPYVDGLKPDQALMNNTQYSSSIENFVTLEGRIPAEALGQPTDWNSDGAYENENYQGYLTSSLVVNALSASTIEEIKNLHKNIFFDEEAMQGNFSVFDEMHSTVLDYYQDPLTANEDFQYFINYTTRYPYYIAIKIPTTARAGYSYDKDLYESLSAAAEAEDYTFFSYGVSEEISPHSLLKPGLIASGFVPKFLKTLKDIFITGSDTLQPTERSYFVYNTYDAISSDGELADAIVATTASAANFGFRVVPYMDLLVYAHNHYEQQMPQDDCCFMGPNTYSRMAAMDRGGEYRYSTTIDALNLIEETRSWLDSSKSITLDSGEAGTSTRSHLGSLQELFSAADNINNTRHVETMAFRIEKIGGPPTGDSRTENVLQNIWLFNSDTGLEAKKYLDSQVKYGENYTYNVYAYVLVQGLKYKYKDIALSRQLGASYYLPGPGFDPPAGIDNLYCLEYYDPSTASGGAKTGLSVPALPMHSLIAATDGYVGRFVSAGEYITAYDFSEEEITIEAPWTPGVMSTYDSPFYSRAAASSDAVQNSSDQYRAEFNIQHEASLDIIEIPIFTKTLKVLDNPPNRLQVDPFPIDDNTQRIGFALKYGADHTDVYPTVLSTADSAIKQDYLHSKDFIEGQAITAWSPGSTEYSSRSLQAQMEVYRLDRSPSSLDDFNGALHSTIGLGLPAENKIEGNKTIADFYDTIQTNHKYYYVFRAINEQGIPGDLSPIYEAQLVDDGGYKFAIFNTLVEEELNPKPLSVSKNLKKIFEIIPNVNHTMLNTENVDFTQPAHTQMETVKADIGSSLIQDTIWTETFKFRLTSKKTGRKIDLNIKYNLNSE